MEKDVPGLDDPQSGKAVAGHRQRLKRRFLDHGTASFADYELLELLLFNAIPRRDTKPVAKALLARFGNVAEVLAAEPKALMEVTGVGEGAVVALKSVEAAAQRMLRDAVIQKPVLSSWEKLLDYCRATLARESREHFRVLYLNRKNVLIADEEQQRGTVDHTPVYPREVVKRALDLGASAIIMLHNHPSGDPTPSQGDIAMTREVAEAARHLGIALHDHVIVARAGHVSFKAEGLI